MLVIDDFLIEEHFRPPEGTIWSMKKWRKSINRQGDVRFMNAKLRPENWDDIAWKNYCSQSLDNIFPEAVVIHNEGSSFADAIISNPIYRPLLSSIGIDANHKMVWVGAICKEVLANPTSKLLKKVKKLSRHTGLPEVRPVGIQFRTNFDVGSPNMKYLTQFVESVTLELQLSTKNMGKRVFYIATDDRNASVEISRGVARFGDSITTRRKIVHTGGLHTGIQATFERVLFRLFGERARRFDFFFFLPSQIRPRPHTWVLAEWFLLGECDPIYSNFTTFGISAAARRGNSSSLFKFDERIGKVVPLVDNIYAL
jgi:hypothetical protein